METIQLTTEIGPDGTLRIVAPTHCGPGPAEVLVVVQPLSIPDVAVDWGDAYGLGKEIWGGIDAQEYVNRMRDEWER